MTPDEAIDVLDTWLREVFLPQMPAHSLVVIGVVVRRRDARLGGDLIVNVAPTPEHRRASAAVAQEGERWLITLAGYFGDHPPTDEQNFLEFARNLPVPEIHEIARSAEPLSEPADYRFRANQRRRYKRLERFPEGFLVIGDALCSFTPIYGQGMSVAALEALAMRDCLAVGTSRLAGRFFNRASKAVDIAWTITVGNDLWSSNDPASRKLPARVINWYLAKMQVAARHDPELSLAFLHVGNLTAAPPTLLRPRLALRVLRDNLRASRRDLGAAVHHQSEPESGRAA